MKSRLREGLGAVLLVSALATLGVALWGLHHHDFVEAVLGTVIGLAFLGAGVELFRASMAE